jgi:hypothetical protein
VTKKQGNAVERNRMRRTPAGKPCVKWQGFHSSPDMTMWWSRARYAEGALRPAGQALTERVTEAHGPRPQTQAHAGTAARPDNTRTPGSLSRTSGMSDGNQPQLFRRNSLVGACPDWLAIPLCFSPKIEREREAAQALQAEQAGRATGATGTGTPAPGAVSGSAPGGEAAFPERSSRPRPA